MDDGIADSIEQPTAENQHTHGNVNTGDIDRQQPRNERPNRSNEISHSNTPLERKPVFNELINAKGEKISQHSNDNGGEIPEYKGNDGVPVH